MKKYLLIILFLNFFVSSTKAEITYIDLNFLLSNSKVGMSLNRYLKKLDDDNNLKFKSIESELIKKEQTLIAQQNILEKSEFEKKINNLSKEVQKYRGNKKISIENIKKIKVENTKKILNLLNPIITKYVEDNSITLVLPKKNIIVGKKKLDITNDILKLFNEQVTQIDFK